ALIASDTRDKAAEFSREPQTQHDFTSRQTGCKQSGPVCEAPRIRRAVEEGLIQIRNVSAICRVSRAIFRPSEEYFGDVLQRFLCIDTQALQAGDFAVPVWRSGVRCPVQRRLVI